MKYEIDEEVLTAPQCDGSTKDEYNGTTCPPPDTCSPKLENNTSYQDLANVENVAPDVDKLPAPTGESFDLLDDDDDDDDDDDEDDDDGVLVTHGD